MGVESILIVKIDNDNNLLSNLSELVSKNLMCDDKLLLQYNDDKLADKYKLEIITYDFTKDLSDSNKITYEKNKDINNLNFFILFIYLTI